MAKQVVTVLGATGSIGVSTLDVISRHPERFDVFALTAHTQVQKLAEQCQIFNPCYAVVRCEQKVKELKQLLSSTYCKTEVLVGDDAFSMVASAPEVDTVMAAIVGAAGLLPTFAAVKAGKRVLLANKESLVMSGHIFMTEAKKTGAMILPTDSEHNAIFQALPDTAGELASKGVEKLLLTGSGGPFRETDVALLKDMTPEQACSHPNWSMGKKISVDSATMMNKGLEFIEACWLFDAKPSDIEVVIHPQSIIHSMVRYIDGSVVAQLGQPDMRTPIAYCLGWPERIGAGVAPLDFTSMSNLTFSAPDYARFPALKASMDAMVRGGSFPVALNAANEVAVEAFLACKIRFTDIYRVIDQVLQGCVQSEPTCIEAVLESDLEARQQARSYLAQV